MKGVQALTLGYEDRARIHGRHTRQQQLFPLISSSVPRRGREANQWNPPNSWSRRLCVSSLKRYHWRPAGVTVGCVTVTQGRSEHALVSAGILISDSSVSALNAYLALCSQVFFVFFLLCDFPQACR